MGTRAVYKYRLDTTDRQQVTMPVGSVVLCVHEQSRWLALWAEVDIDTDLKEIKTIVVKGTGHPIPEEQMPLLRYLGTGFVDSFVWHVYEEEE